jgi:HAD superfamily hydrolase (TIGR01509 family)
MSKYKCIIFDCDGVLVDSEAIGNQVLVDMANSYGANINLEYALTHFKGNAMQTCYNHIQKLVNQPLAPNFVAEYRHRSFIAFREHLQPVKGIPELLPQLQQHFCVASSGPPEKIEHNLKITGLLPHFKDKIFSCYTINKWKPEPDVFLWAAETMGFTPNECLVIEDSVIGVQAAKAGGFEVFGYTAHDMHQELKHHATQTFKDMHSLLELL